MSGNAVRFVAPEPRLFDSWKLCYAEYGRTVGDSVDDDIAARVWSWLIGGTHGLTAVLGLSDDETVVGFAHFRPFPRTLHANEACFLDDLYVLPSYRRRGLAGELIRCVCSTAAREGWTEVRWVTAADNEAAQRLYERIAAKSDLITFRLFLKS